MERVSLNRIGWGRIARIAAAAMIAAGLSAGGSRAAHAQATLDPPADESIAEPGGQLLPNLAAPTLGGTQLWTDELVYRQWRIQRHALTRHCRLLDEHDVRLAWGTFDECEGRLQARMRERSLTPMQGTVVIVLHGLGRSRDSTQSLCRYLKENSTMTPIAFGYASTRNSLAESAAALRSVIEHLGPDVREIHLVGHSLGNIVVRRYLQTPLSSLNPRPVDPRIRRMVMLGPPNRGSAVAAWFQKHGAARMVAGEALSHLAETDLGLDEERSIPRFEFGIIAGGQGDGEGLNRLLEGDDDLLVKVEETRLPGARDFTVVPVIHARLLDDLEVQQLTLRFLQHGHFRSQLERKPIPPLGIGSP